MPPSAFPATYLPTPDRTRIRPFVKCFRSEHRYVVAGCLGPRARRHDQRQSRKHHDRQGCSALLSSSVHHPSSSSACRPTSVGDGAPMLAALEQSLGRAPLPVQQSTTASPLPKAGLPRRFGRLVVFAQQFIGHPKMSSGSGYVAVVRLEICLGG